MQSELKPCPFCGGAPEGKYGSRADINCTSCPAVVSVSLHPGIFTTYEGQRKAEEARAIEAWNRRAALSDKQAVEVKAPEDWELVPKSAIMWLIGAGPDSYGNWFEKPEGAPAFWWRTHFNKLRADAAKLHSALVDVPAVEPVAPSAIDDLTLPVVGTLYVSRGCATARAVRGVENGPDEYSNLVRISDVAAALEPFRSRLSREGEASAEVERLRGLLDVALDALDSYADPTGYTDNNGEQLASDEVVHQGILAKETAVNLRAALAATRSGSATSATIANQAEYDRDRMKLWEVKEGLNPLFTFGSFEPLLGRVILDKYAPDWIITGGETDQGAHKARDTDPDNFRYLRDQSAALGRAFFMKQMTRKAPIPDDLLVRQWPAVTSTAKGAADE